MSTAATCSTVKFHLSLSVTDLSRSVEFYRVLLGHDPAKQHADYAKFELNEPPVILSLIPTPHGTSGVLNHVGIRLADAPALVEVQARLEAAGIRTQREEGVECCYARQTKFWVTDPDGALWELYLLHEDIEEHGAGSVPVHLAGPCDSHPTPVEAVVTWQHLLVDPVPERIPHDDNSVDQVLLEGTINLSLEPARLARLLAEAWRALRQGGTVQAHGLAASQPLTERPRLPGPAALVEYVPVEADALAAFRSAGFVDVHFAKRGSAPCFVAHGAEMREVRIVGVK